jgi:cytochrome c oxidase cbb3-type subunit IV
MFRQFYEGMQLTHLPLFTLLLFFSVFVGVAAWVFLARRGQDYEALARLPLADTSGPFPDSRGERRPS